MSVLIKVLILESWSSSFSSTVDIQPWQNSSSGLQRQFTILDHAASQPHHLQLRLAHVMKLGVPESFSAAAAASQVLFCGNLYVCCCCADD
jgi:hypothetical protein